MGYPTAPPRPSRRAWYAAAPDPELPPVSAKRAYGEILVIYAGFFAAGIVAAALILGNRTGDMGNTNASWGIWMYQTVEFIAEIGLALLVVTAVAARRGVTPRALGLVPMRRPDGSLAVSQLIRICAWCFLAEIVGGIVNALLQSGHIPESTPNAPELIAGFFDAASAGIIEELVVLAFVVVSLRQAGRPWWEVVTVALVLRGAYHIYYGPGVFGILLWAGLYLWIYLRFRQILPLMLCHFMWDGVAFFAQRWIGLFWIGILIVLGLWVTAFVLWLVDRGNRNPYGQLAPAGWPGYYYPADSYPTAGPASYSPGSYSAPAAGSYSAPAGSYWAPAPARPNSAPAGPGSSPSDPGAYAPAAPFSTGPGPAAPTPTGPVSAGPMPAVSPPAAWSPAGGLPTGGSTPPPGWHPDPAGHNRWRWWNGQAWTDHVSRHAAP